MSVHYLSPGSVLDLTEPYPLSSGDVLYMQGATLKCAPGVSAFYPKQAKYIYVIGPGQSIGSDHTPDRLYALLNTHECEHLHVEKVKFHSGNTGAVSHHMPGQLSRVKHGKLIDCEFTGCTGSCGLQIEFSSDIEVRGCESHNNWLDGVKLARECSRVHFNGGSYHHNGAHGSPRGAGVHASGVDITLTGVEMCNNNGDGSMVKSTKEFDRFGHRTGITFQGCHFHDNKDYGFQFAVTNFTDETPHQLCCTIQGCRADGNGEAGFCALGGTLTVVDSSSRWNKRGIHTQTQSYRSYFRRVELIANEDCNVSDWGEGSIYRDIESWAKDVVALPRGNWATAPKVTAKSIDAADPNDPRYADIESIGF